jgi:hypothetical protein
MDSEGEHVRACRAGYAAIPRWCQKAPDANQGLRILVVFGLLMPIVGEPTSGPEPLTSPLYECALIHSWVFLTVRKAACLSHLCLFCVSLCLPSFAQVTVTVTVKLISSQPEGYVRRLRCLPHLLHHRASATHSKTPLAHLRQDHLPPVSYPASHERG